MNIKLSSIVLVFGVTSCLWACGDDDDTADATGGSGGKATGGSTFGGGAGKGGTSAGGKGGSGGTGGTSGGKGGTGGVTSGGKGGTGGVTSGGTAGTGGTVGGGGTDGGAGAGAVGGADGGVGNMGGGGADGGVGGTVGGGGADGGVGGGGAVGGTDGGGGAGGGDTDPPTLAENCTTICAKADALTCVGDDCVVSCIGVSEASGFVAEYDAAIACIAGLPASSLECVPANDGASPNQWLPVAATSCEDEFCAFMCLDDGVTVWDSQSSTGNDRCNCGG